VRGVVPCPRVWQPIATRRVGSTVR
jgi:hypothetical protein